MNLPPTILRRGRAADLPVSTDPAVEAAAWLLSPSDASRLIAAAGWRVSIRQEDGRSAVLDALARTGAWALHTDHPGPAAELIGLAGLDVAVSVFVTSVDQAIEAVSAGATDLVVEDWDDETVGRLRDALAGGLVERTVFPPGTPVDEARRELSPAWFTAWLHAVDGSGVVRPFGAWASGKELPVPAPPRRISAAWTDQAWRSRTSQGVAGASGPVGSILERSLAGRRPDRDEVETLLRARGRDVDAIAEAADELRRRAVGDVVTYVVNRNINYTNVCTYKCRFCAFSKGPRSLDLRGVPYLMSIDDVVGLASEAAKRGATEVCLQGGIHPGFTGEFYLDLVTAIKAALPSMHIHGFTPLEVWQGAATLGLPVDEYLDLLASAGLGTLPGTAAEILDDRVRTHLCPDKITTSQWADVMLTAHRLGLKSTATIMFGHIDDPAAWANHLEVVRDIQRRTGGFTEFVPLPFVHMGAPIYLAGKSRPGPTWDEVVLMHAVARLAFDGLIDNIQASWVKLGLDGAGRLLDAGCNDLGGTLMGESITRSAGASHGQEMSVDALRGLIRSAGRAPRQRTTTYETADEGLDMEASV